MRELLISVKAQGHINDLLLSEPKLVKKIFSLIADIQNIRLKELVNQKP